MIAHHVAREQITVSSAVKTLTDTKVETESSADNSQRVAYAEIQVQDDQVRVTFDGSTAPLAATNGELWNALSKHRVWSIQQLLKLKFIRETTDALLVINYYGNAA